MINKLILYIFLFILSFNCLATPYSRTYISSTSGSYHGDGDGTILFLLLGFLAAYIYYRFGLEWIDRRKNKKKLTLQLPETIGEWVTSFIFIAFLSLCMSLLIFVVVDFFWGRDAVKSILLYVWAIFFVIAIVATT